MQFTAPSSSRFWKKACILSFIGSTTVQKNSFPNGSLITASSRRTALSGFSLFSDFSIHGECSLVHLFSRHSPFSLTNILFVHFDAFGHNLLIQKVICCWGNSRVIRELPIYSPPPPNLFAQQNIPSVNDV